MQNTTLKKVMGLTCLTFALSISAIFSSESKAAASDYTDKELVWSDEFSGTSLNTDSWSYEYGNNGTDGNLYAWGNNEKQYYKSENVSIADISADTESYSADGKALAITAKRESAGNCNYTSGRIKTAGKQSFKYGRIEAKMKMDNGMCQGIWPAFWMLGTTGGGWPMCGEIDIMEHANANRYVGGALHWAKLNNEHAYSGASGAFKYGDMDSWHVYAIEWDKDKITWYLDDVAYYTVKIDDEKSEINTEFYILFNVAVGGNYIGNQLPLYTWEKTVMYVDYVRVYQKAEQGGSYTGTWQKDPIWNVCNVTFYDGDTTVVSGTVNIGDYLANISHSKAGYDFLGWYTSDGKLFDFNKPVTVDTLNLYAKFQPKQAETTTIAPQAITLKKPVIKSLKSNTKRKVTIKMKTKDEAIGFQIKYGTNKKITKNVKTKITKKKTYTFKKLKSKKTYYFKIREYKINAKGKKVYSTWTKVKKVKVK